MGLFAAPNQTGIMNSLPPDQRGAGAGMAGTIMNSASVLSIGIFFSLIIVGLSSNLPSALYHASTPTGFRTATRSRSATCRRSAACSRRSSLGYNPMGQLLHPIIHTLPHAKAAYMSGPTFFPHLVSQPFAKGIHEAFYFAAVCCVISAIASWMRGGKYFYQEPAQTELTPEPQPVP